MHTATYCLTRYISMLIDVDKLISLSVNLPVVRRKLDTLEAGKINRSSSTGFSKKRYTNTDIKHPILISEDDKLLDGRHRLARLHDAGRQFCRVRVVPYAMLKSCIIRYLI